MQVVDLSQYTGKDLGGEKVPIGEMFDPNSERGKIALAHACQYADKLQQEVLDKAEAIGNGPQQ